MTIPTALLALAACNPADPPNAAAEAEAEMAANVAAIEANLTVPAPAATAADGRDYVALTGAWIDFEAEAARLALEKSRGAQVRALARDLLDQQQAADRELEAAAGGAEPPIPVASALSAAQQAQLQALRTAGGAAFDQLWLEQQVAAHEAALSLASDFAANGDAASLRRHAAAAASLVMARLSRLRELTELAARPDDAPVSGTQP